MFVKVLSFRVWHVSRLAPEPEPGNLGHGCRKHPFKTRFHRHWSWFPPPPTLFMPPVKTSRNRFQQEIIKVRGWIPHIGSLTTRGYYSRIAWMFSWRICLHVCRFVSFRFVSKQRESSNTVGMSSWIFWLQVRELRLSVFFNTFRNFNKSLNKRRTSPVQTITTEWTGEKCFDKLTNKRPNTR